MKIAVAQINTIVGNIESNKNKIIDSIKIAKKDNADLVVFPEMTLTGYPIHDLIHELAFVEQQDSAITDIIAATSSIAVSFGFIDYDKGKPYLDRSYYKYNAVMIVQNKKMLEIRRKSLLPNYDVFNEKRYFKKAEKQEPVKLKLQGKDYKIGFHICEDLWDEHYDVKVSEVLVSKGAEILINQSASPFAIDKFAEREEIVAEKVKSLKVPYLYCNLVGNQDELIFDGHSFAFDKNGKKVYQATGFKETIETIDIFSENKIQTKIKSDDELIYNALIFALNDYFKKNNFTKAVIGLSGGIDSALVAALSVKALGSENVLCISMPSKYSSDHSVEDAEKLANNLNCAYKEIPINNIHSSFETMFQAEFQDETIGLADENIQARIRGNILMAHSNQSGYIVLSTGNKTEFALGYCTLYGDMCGAVSVIGDLSKERVYSISRWINEDTGKEMIPNRIIKKLPSAELRPDQFDPFDYEKISPLVDLIVEGRKNLSDLIEMGYEETEAKEIMNSIYSSEFKRFQAAIIFKISSKAFGTGRIYPIVNQYRI